MVVHDQEVDMTLVRMLVVVGWSLAVMLVAVPSQAADYPAPVESRWVVRDFRFHTPASEDTLGHGTTGQARFWKQHLADLLQSAPRRTK
jgi:hypothetical protein